VILTRTGPVKGFSNCRSFKANRAASLTAERHAGSFLLASTRTARPPRTKAVLEP
jgi:hypothetical protein